MFGESESESPRVPSPWDSLISSPPSPAPKPKRGGSPSPLSLELIPQLVPESDDGNVEYKLQLLNPSPARFARLVTQMKWRLLEGGGQAYYELGVADSGHLIGLPREDLEQSLETLEMMAGEIGASVIVVKEIEVPEALVDFAAVHSKDWGDGTGKRSRRRDALMLSSEDGGDSTSTLLSTETETDSVSATDVDDDIEEDLSLTIVLEKDSVVTESHQHAHTANGVSTNSVSIVSREPEDNADADDELSAPVKTLSKFSVDLEISSVYKPRPMKARMYHRIHHSQAHSSSGKNKRSKKPKFQRDDAGEQDLLNGDITAKQQRANNRQQVRDLRREEKRKTLLAVASQAVTVDAEASVPVDSSAVKADELASGLESLHVDVNVKPSASFMPEDVLGITPDEVEGDDDVFASPMTAKSSFPSFKGSIGESHLDVDVGATSALATGNDKAPRLIVEALVVRKMSLEEAFLDFGGFSLS